MPWLSGGSGESRLWPLYEEAERLQIPLAFHPNAPGAEGTERWQTFFCAHTVGFAFELMQAFLGIMVSGVLERCPRLRVGFFEGGCGWVPCWLDRIDEHYEKRPEEAPLLKGKPSEYVREGRVFFSFGRETACSPIAWSGSGRTSFSSRRIIPTGICIFPMR